MAHVGNFTFNVVSENRTSDIKKNVVPFAYAEKITGLKPRYAAYASAIASVRKDSDDKKGV